jgi:anti-sigma B factor antagonist
MAELTPTDGALEGALTMAVEQVDGRAVVSLSGELDLSGTAHFESQMAPIMDRADLDEIVFDLAQLGFIDSSGLAVLVKTAASGKRVILRRPSTLVREVVAITGLQGVLPVEP